MPNKEEIKYRGFTIVSGDYLGSGKYWWEVVGYYCSLDSNDKGWDSHQHAQSYAKKQIDLFLAGEKQKLSG